MHTPTCTPHTYTHAHSHAQHTHAHTCTHSRTHTHVCEHKYPHTHPLPCPSRPLGVCAGPCETAFGLGNGRWPFPWAPLSLSALGAHRAALLLQPRPECVRNGVQGPGTGRFRDPEALAAAPSAHVSGYLQGRGCRSGSACASPAWPGQGGGRAGAGCVLVLGRCQGTQPGTLTPPWSVGPRSEDAAGVSGRLGARPGTLRGLFRSGARWGSAGAGGVFHLWLILAEGGVWPGRPRGPQWQPCLAPPYLPSPRCQRAPLGS